MSGLVHRRDEIAPDVVALICHACRMRHSREEYEDFELLGDELLCVGCGTGGLIPTVVAMMEDRFPASLARRFTPLPEALMDHREELGLGARELVLVWALERHRRAKGDLVYPSRERLAELSGMSTTSVKRALAVLAAAGLVAVQQWHFPDSGRRTTNHYDLDPLWQKLSEMTAGQIDPRWGREHKRTPETASEPPLSPPAGLFDPPTAGQIDLRTAGQIDPTEVDTAVKEDPAVEVDPDGTSPASPEPRGRLPSPDDRDETSPARGTYNLNLDREARLRRLGWVAQHVLAEALGVGLDRVERQPLTELLAAFPVEAAA